MTQNEYLVQILAKYAPRSLLAHDASIRSLKSHLITWASSCYVDIIDSGSRAKGTAISLSSDVDYLVSLTSNCNEGSGGLQSCYESLYDKLVRVYSGVRKQNVSLRIKINDLEVDITPARKHSGNSNYHNLFVSKNNSWKQTNIQKHIKDVSASGRTNEIRLFKIWRELNALNMPSIYIEYLLMDKILFGKSKSLDDLAVNFHHVLMELSKSENNPIFKTVTDPSNTNNVLSDVISNGDKNRIIAAAKKAMSMRSWDQIIW